VASFTDRRYLLGNQYRDAANLETRISLHRRFSTSSKGWHAWVFERLRVPSGGAVLELGCGQGLLWTENEAPGSWRITLSDFSPGMLQRARERLAPERPSEAHARRPESDSENSVASFEFRLIDAHRIPVQGGSYDAVIANHMLYHLADRPRALAEIRRVLKGGGWLHAATNGKDHLSELEPFYRILDPGHRRMTEPFNLENGEGQLAKYFPEIELHRYPDALLVTEVQPLVDYILSTASAASTTEERVAALRRGIDERLAENGSIRVTKSTGMFLAKAL
jgi:SAM-dependent methyltransferase